MEYKFTGIVNLGKTPTAEFRASGSVLHWQRETLALHVRHKKHLGAECSELEKGLEALDEFLGLRGM